ncbi:hypothetical protein [Amycolatopsis sp. NPDC004378]
MSALLWWLLSGSGLASSAGDRQQVLDLLKIALTLTGGIGGVIFLMVAYRKQRLGEVAEQREVAASRREETKLFTDRFMKAAEQLGHAIATVRLAGVYAMAELADETIERRQMCINVLCAHLRMHCEPQPPSSVAGLAQWHGEREVRQSIFRVIADHLRGDVPVSWQGHDFDFTGALIDSADFHAIRVTGGTVSFEKAVFPGGKVDFDGAVLSGGVLDFSGAIVSGGTLNLGCVKLAGSVVHFHGAELRDGFLDFSYSWLTGGALNLDDMNLAGGSIDFGNAKFSGTRVTFSCARFEGAWADFRHAKFLAGTLAFGDCSFNRGSVEFGQAEFAGGYVGVHRASYGGCVIHFENPKSWDTPPIIDTHNDEDVTASVRLPVPAADDRLDVMPDGVHR